MVKSRLSRETHSGAGSNVSLREAGPSANVGPREAMRRVNAALRRLIRRYQREFETIARGTGTRPGFSRTLAEVELNGLRFVLARVSLRQLEPLTERQREIALSVAVGMSNKEVGNRLEISPATVASHLRVIYRKLNVDSRSALLLRILATGA